MHALNLIDPGHDEPATGGEMTNRRIALAFLEVAELLQLQSANPFRIAAYCSAARLLQSLDRPASEILAREGIEGLQHLPDVGESLSGSMAELIETGRWKLLERLRHEAYAHDPLASLPGVGAELAQRIREHTGIRSLDELQLAAYDGRLRGVPGVGRKRMRGIRESLAARFGRRPRVQHAARHSDRDPSVATLLEIDAEYCRLADSGRLPLATPHDYNPTGAAWLPVLHIGRGMAAYTAMFSNTAQVHAAGMLRDWLVIARDDGQAGPWTVVTAWAGRLKGKRVVRGREDECREHYDSLRTQRELPLDSFASSNHLRQPFQADSHSPKS